MARLTEGPETQSADDVRQSDGPSLKLVFGVLAIVTVVVGVLAYWRYANSERWVAEGVAKMDRIGAELEPEGCIDESLSWYGDCDEQQANAAVCLQGVSILMYHCLAAADRQDTCELYLDPDSAVHQPTEAMRERARKAETAGNRRSGTSPAGERRSEPPSRFSMAPSSHSREHSLRPGHDLARRRC